MPFTIAIDGPAASGKGTIARALAVRFGFAYLDTGRLYRAVGARVLEGMEAAEAAQTLTPDMLDREDLRRPDVARAASQVAAIPEVRAALVDFQRAFARREGGAVLDGRDIGTVICPDAEAKLYVTASDEVRAVRRHAEELAAGHDVTLEAVLSDLRERDRRDSARAEAPLTAAADAVEIDTSELSIDAALDAATQAVLARRPGAAV